MKHLHPAIELLPTPSPAYPSTRGDASWRQAHIHAVCDHLDGTLHGPERAILAMGDGLHLFILASGVDWTTAAWEAEQFAPAIRAFQQMLNLDVGRLDAGTLSRWAEQMFELIGWDSDTGARA